MSQLLLEPMKAHLPVEEYLVSSVLVIEPIMKPIFRQGTVLVWTKSFEVADTVLAHLSHPECQTSRIIWVPMTSDHIEVGWVLSGKRWR